MSNLLDIHNRAMDLALLGDKSDDKDKASEYYVEAFELEKDAAYMAEELGNPEPGLSILFRSAASLALQCGRLRDAEKLIAHALGGNPTDDVARELREMLQQIYEIDGSDKSITYRLSVPKSESGLFTTIVSRMGWTVESFKNTLGKIAM